MSFVEDVLVLMNSKPDPKQQKDFRNIHSRSFKASSLNHSKDKSKQNCFCVSFTGILLDNATLFVLIHIHTTFSYEFYRRALINILSWELRTGSDAVLHMSRIEC